MEESKNQLNLQPPTIGDQEETKSELCSHNHPKDASDADSDSGEERGGKRRSAGNQLDYEKLMKQPFGVLHEKVKSKSDNCYLILMKVLTMIFEGKNLTEQDLKFLNTAELNLLAAFFAKKCKVSFSSQDKLSKIAELINCHKSSYKHKRNEENYKLVFKKAIKHLTKTFKKEHPELKVDKNKLVLGFYKKYFKDDFVKKGLDKEYDLPKNDCEKLVNNFNSLIYNPKTVNPKYISMVANSKIFVDHVVEFLNDHFMETYVKSRFTKVERILDTCKELVQMVDITGSNKELVDKIEKNPRFKLPWYDDELIKAVKCVKTYLTSKCGVPLSKFKI